ncbi:MAG: integrase family protein [Burkholderiales bacterium]
MPKLTAITIEKTRADKHDILLADGGCLYLRVRPSGARVWIARIKRQGKRRVFTLGAYPETSIKDARAKAAARVAIERGTARVTVSEAVEQYMDAQIRSSYRRVGNAEVYARAVTKDLGALSVDAVRPVDVSRMVAAYRRRAPVAAMRLLAFTKALFAWCASFGYADRSPAANVEARTFGVKEEARERVLTAEEIRAFWHADDLPHVPLLRFLLLTGLRIAEAQRAEVGRIDRAHWLTIPPEHAKNGKEHRVYLPPLARAQIEREARPHLFFAVSPTAVQAGLHRWHDRHGLEDRWTPHDLRRTFASLCGDVGVAPHVIAKLLNHTIPGGSALPVYLRSEWLDERKDASERLAARVAATIQQRHL